MMSWAPNGTFKKTTIKQTMRLASLLDSYAIEGDGCLCGQPSRFILPIWQVCSGNGPLYPDRFSPSQGRPLRPYGHDRPSQDPARADPGCRDPSEKGWASRPPRAAERGCQVPNVPCWTVPRNSGPENFPASQKTPSYARGSIQPTDGDASAKTGPGSTVSGSCSITRGRPWPAGAGLSAEMGEDQQRAAVDLFYRPRAR